MPELGAARTIAVLSPDYLTSQYGSAEWEAAWASDPAGERRGLLVARVRECERGDSRCLLRVKREHLGTGGLRDLPRTWFA